MRTAILQGTGESVPVIGQGTWVMGEDPRRFAREADALRLGISLGMTLINTAEIYGVGGAERVVGAATADCRDGVFLVTKIWPSHADPAAAQAALAGSLRRLGTDHVDAVLLHWPTSAVPLAETLGALRRMTADGMTRYAGMSNFSGRWATGLERAAGPSDRLAFDELPYSLSDRRAERREIPAAARLGRVVLAYSPLGHGRQRSWPGYAALREVAAARAASPEEVALAWVVRAPGVVAIPKAVSKEHVRANAAAGDLVLSDAELSRLDAAFPAASRDMEDPLPTSGAFFRLAYFVLRTSAAVRVAGRRPSWPPA